MGKLCVGVRKNNVDLELFNSIVFKMSLCQYVRTQGHVMEVVSLSRNDNDVTPLGEQRESMGIDEEP